MPYVNPAPAKVRVLVEAVETTMLADAPLNVSPLVDDMFQEFPVEVEVRVIVLVPKVIVLVIEPEVVNVEAVRLRLFVCSVPAVTANPPVVVKLSWNV